jgi:KaiC/GvpD/RAD55 family RecA-like ATPase
VSTRRLRIVKYRGTTHGTNEYPFLIDAHGISVLPLSSLGLDHAVSDERLSSGIDGLDDMLGGKGYYRGSSILVTGTAGTGKTSVASHFALAAAKRGERVLYLAFEESPQQMQRNLRSIGIDLAPYLKKRQMRIEASRPTFFGLEMHLVHMHKLIAEFKPTVVVVDPISNFIDSGSAADARALLLRLVDFLKVEQITALFTHLTRSGGTVEGTDVGISSLIDTWSLTRWSSRITQSDTYSSRPWRVSEPSPRSPVMTAVTPLSFRKRNSRRSSERSSAWFSKPLNSDSMVSSTTRLAPTESIARPRRRNRPSRSNSPVSWISLRSTRT